MCEERYWKGNVGSVMEGVAGAGMELWSLVEQRRLVAAGSLTCFLQQVCDLQ